MMNRFTAVTAAMLIAAAGAVAQDSSKPAPKAPSGEKQPAKSLKVGDKAPDMSVENWIKGNKVEKFENGKVYVVEFWATWCGPCIAAFPHLSKLQKEYKDKGVTVIGVAASEKAGGSEVVTNLKKFVREQGKAMDYTVGYDSDKSMSKFWMQPANQRGIPCSFVVGKDGKIAFIGHPMNGLDEAVAKAVGGGKAAIDAPAYNTVLVNQPEKAAAQPATPAAKEKKAQPETTEATLILGDKAPELTVSKWVKGEPVTGFEKGKTYVVEFWATWCGPCIKTIPHLTELQKKHKDVKIIGVSVWESDQAKVEPFVADMGEKMDYTVAMDEVAEGEKGSNGKMAKNWMTAAKRSGIPSAFIINGEGRVAWIGHPAQMDKPLELIASGKWDLAKEAADAKAKAQAEAKLRPLMAKFREAMQGGNTDGALAALDELIPLDKANEVGLSQQKFVLLMEKGDLDAAYAWGNKIVDGVGAENSMLLNTVAWTIVDPEATPSKQDLKLALKAATKANELTKGEDPAITDTLAKVYFDSGDIAKALEWQEKAAKLAEGTQFEEEIKARLEEFRKAAKKKG